MLFLKNLQVTGENRNLDMEPGPTAQHEACREHGLEWERVQTQLHRQKSVTHSPVSVP